MAPLLLLQLIDFNAIRILEHLVMATSQFLQVIQASQMNQKWDRETCQQFGGIVLLFYFFCSHLKQVVLLLLRLFIYASKTPPNTIPLVFISESKVPPVSCQY